MLILIFFLHENGVLEVSWFGYRAGPPDVPRFPEDRGGSSHSLGLYKTSISLWPRGEPPDNRAGFPIRRPGGSHARSPRPRPRRGPPGNRKGPGPRQILDDKSRISSTLISVEPDSEGPCSVPCEHRSGVALANSVLKEHPTKTPGDGASTRAGAGLRFGCQATALVPVDQNVTTLP